MHIEPPGGVAGCGLAGRSGEDVSWQAVGELSRKTQERTRDYRPAWQERGRRRREASHP